MSEKMDGVRGYWNGKNLISRNRNNIHCPKWFIEGLPSTTALDGELWMGRDHIFSKVNSILNSKDGDWSQIGYYIFDIPSSSGTYEVRMKEMEDLKSIVAPHIHIVENIQSAGVQHLLKSLDSVMAARGEGIMLRAPNSSYIAGPNSSLLKAKVNYVFTINYTFSSYFSSLLPSEHYLRSGGVDYL